MTAGVVQEPGAEKQIGCMAGFFNIFDRQQNITGRRNYAIKRLPPPPYSESPTPSEMSLPATPRGSEKRKPGGSADPSGVLKQSPVTDPVTPTRSPLPFPVFDLANGSKSRWKPTREAPRLSLDSRAILDARGTLKPRTIQTNVSTLTANSCEHQDEAEEKQRRSPSVVARLMGLDRLPSTDSDSPLKAELRRSASESRVNKDQYPLGESFEFLPPQSCSSSSLQQQNLQSHLARDVDRDERHSKLNAYNGFRETCGPVRRKMDQKDFVVRSTRAEPARATAQRGMLQRKNFDSADFFPEPKQNAFSRETDKIGGMDGTCKDLETLKLILEALQLKGLLHPSRPQTHAGNRNFVYEQSFLPQDAAPIIVMKPTRSLAHSYPSSRPSTDASSTYKSYNAPRRVPRDYGMPAISHGPDRSVIGRTDQGRPRARISTSQGRNECNRRPNRRSSAVDNQKRMNEPAEGRIQSPTAATRRNGTIKMSNIKSPRSRKPKGCTREEEVCFQADHEVPGFHESNTSHPITERLERCGKLLNSIAEFTATSNACDSQPSPVSVLDSSFCKESSPSPIMKRSLDFRDQLVESEDEASSSGISSTESKSDEKSDDVDFLYISDILRASNYLPGDTDIFLLLEKQHCLKGKDTSKASRLERKLIFDATNELLERQRILPPWKAASRPGHLSLDQIWSEFQKIRERDVSDDLFEAICGVLKKDLAGDGINAWEDCQIEVSQAVFYMERHIFKDLIGETITDLADSLGTALPRRKLTFERCS